MKNEECATAIQKMNYDFDEIVNRRGTDCVKWDEELPIRPDDQLSKQPDDVIPLWVADMDFRAAPAIIDALRRRVDHGVFGYTQVPESYYEAVISWFSRRHSWTIQREWIQYTTGVVPALSVVIKALTQPGDEVILQTPVYNCFFSSVRNNGCTIVENRLKRNATSFEMDYDDLAHCAASPRAKVLVLCNPHNPVGHVWTSGELSRLYNICKKNGVIVVSDEIHNELTFRGRRYVPFGTVAGMDGTISAAGRNTTAAQDVVVLTSPSKSFNTAGLQIANIICANDGMRRRIDRAINVNEVCDVNPFGVVALQAAYNESEAWLDALCEYIWQNYEMLRNFFVRELPQFKVMPLEGTYLVWVDISAAGMTSDALADCLLREAAVRVNSGTMYGQAGEGFIRLNIACPRSRLMEALRRISRFFGSMTQKDGCNFGEFDKKA